MSDYSDYLEDESNSDDNRFEQIQLKGIEPKKVLKLYSGRLTEYEREEILNYDKIYFIGKQKSTKKPDNEFNDGFDDDRGIYYAELHDHIAYRYELLSSFGKGAFGNVYKVFDHKHHINLALKVIRNKSAYNKIAKTEIKILKYLKSADPNDEFNFVQMDSYFMFRNHVCITFELLNINLYHYLKKNKFIGCSLPLIRRFAYSIVKSLCALRELKIIHCDLKLENIVLRSNGKSGIKLIDFGSSCFETKTFFKYIISRYYRAPEVIVQLKYGCEIDMFSFGCLIAELASGKVLFEGSNSLHQLALIMEIFGYLPLRFQQTKVYSQDLMQSEYYIGPQQQQELKNDTTTSSYINSKQNRHKVLPPGTKDPNFLYERCKKSRELTDFVRNCLTIEPEKRMKPKQALEHNFLKLKNDKIKQILNRVELLPKSYLIDNTQSTASQSKI